MKNRKIAILLAFTSGMFGAHRFYLGQKKLAWYYLAFSWTLLPFFVGLIDGIRFLCMSYATFNRKYSLGHEFRKVFPDDETLLEASTDPKREKELLAKLEEMKSPENIELFLESAKKRGEYLPRIVYAKARHMSKGEAIIYQNRLDLHS
ncbi:MAG: TM2 domain-containing protein [Cyclobacteriaceae bacterium]